MTPPVDPRPCMGLLGFGAFARFMAKHLAPHFDVVAYDRAPTPDDADAAARAVPRVPLAEAARADTVVVAVTMDGFADVVRAAAPHVRAGSLVLDVASVKIRPAALLREAFSARDDVDLLGLHPMFGPQSGADGIAGLRCAVCPLRIDDGRLARVRRFLADALGLVTVDTDPDAHDREMARVQALTHFISRGLRGLSLSPSPLATRSYTQLLRFAEVLLSDSPALFMTIERDNPHAAPIRRRFLDALAALERDIGEKDD